MIRVVNIKASMPPADYAVFMVDEAISDAKQMGEKAIIVVHGYGSRGVGGAIKKAVVNYLTTAKKMGNIITYVCGDKWGDMNPDKSLMCKVCPELILNSQLFGLNSGATAVLITK